MIKQLITKIISNEEVAPGYFKLTLKMPQIAKRALPGQFIHIRVGRGFQPLLRRPFSIHRIRRQNVEILYKLVGKGTGILSERKAGERLDVLGPLGNGFDLSAIISAAGGSALGRIHPSPILVAGGMGVAPLLFLAERLPHKARIKVLIGAKNRDRIICRREFKGLGAELSLATEDGSCGFKGKVTDLLKKHLSTIDYRLSTIYACGPKPMLKEIARISQRYRIKSWVSLEENIACGLGACLGCAVKTRDGYKRVCKEGPIFDASYIVW